MADNVDLTATMTANNSPSPNVTSASTEFDAFNAAWHAFDKNTATGWASNSVTTGWVKYDFGSGNTHVIRKYTITNLAAYPERAPKDFTLQGSNDDSSWTTIDTRTSQTSWSGKREFTANNSIAYRYYKLDVTAVDGGTLIHIAEIELMTVAGGGILLFM